MTQNRFFRAKAYAHHLRALVGCLGIAIVFWPVVHRPCIFLSAFNETVLHRRSSRRGNSRRWHSEQEAVCPNLKTEPRLPERDNSG